MKVLSDNNIASVSGKDLGFYLGEDSHHKAINALNDIPSVQWVAGYPDDPAQVVSFNNDTGRFEVVSYFYLQGNSSMSCIYFGKFQTDRMIWSATYNYDTNTGGAVDPNYPFDNYQEEIEVPIRVYNSLRDFVTGKFTFYTDYFKTLNELGYSTPYILADHTVRVQLISEYDTLRHSVNKEVGWQALTETSFTYNNQTYYLQSGNLIDLRTNVAIGINNYEMTSPLSIGSWMLLHKTTDPTDTANYLNPDLIQLVSVRGEGDQFADLTVISNKPYSSLVSETINGTLNNTSHVQQILTGTRIGLIRSGNFEEFPNAQVGMSKSYKDYSVRTELINGGHQYINRNAAKSFNGSMVLERDQVARLMRFAESQRARPFPMDVLTGMELETPKSLFCIFEQLPEERLSYRTGEVRDVTFSVKQIY